MLEFSGLLILFSFFFLILWFNLRGRQKEYEKEQSARGPESAMPVPLVDKVATGFVLVLALLSLMIAYGFSALGDAQYITSENFTYANFTEYINQTWNNNVTIQNVPVVNASIRSVVMVYSNSQTRFMTDILNLIYACLFLFGVFWVVTAILRASWGSMDRFTKSQAGDYEDGAEKKR